MSLSNMISKFRQTIARVFLGFNQCDCVFPHHATKLERNHQASVKSSDQAQRKNNAAEVELGMPESEVMECWSIGPGYTWCGPGTHADLDATSTQNEK